MLMDLDGDHVLTIGTGLLFPVCKVTVALFATRMCLCDMIVIFVVPTPVELSIADRRRGLLASHALRSLVVHVQMLGATRLLLTTCTTSMLCEDIGTIDITLKGSISEPEFILL